jgi:AcrR family transcriptional regulator
MPRTPDTTALKRDKRSIKEIKGRSYGGASADERAAERRTKMMDAGLRVIGEVGYNATTVRAICAEAGLTERYFYESFENSEDLLCAVYARIIEDTKQRALKALLGARRDPEAMARAVLGLYFQICRDPNVARVMLFEVLGVSARVDRLYRQAMEDFAELIRNSVQMDDRVQHLQKLDQGMLSAALVGAVVQIAMRWVLGGYKQSLDSVVTSAYTIFVAVNRQVLQTPKKPARP